MPFVISLLFAEQAFEEAGGGFGGKVPVYPGYVIAVAASVLTGKPVKWIEDRMENLQADSFARDYHITAELAGKKDGQLTALRIKTIADHGYTDAAANPSKFPAGLFHVCTGSYDLKAAHVEVDGVYTNKPPGGIAYRCSFRVTEAVHTIERMADLMAHELKMDPAEFRMKNFIKPEQNVGEGLETPARRGHTRLIFCVFCEQYSRSV